MRCGANETNDVEDQRPWMRLGDSKKTKRSKLGNMDYDTRTNLRTQYTLTAKSSRTRTPSHKRINVRRIGLPVVEL